MIMDYGGFNRTVGSVWVHFCGFEGEDGLLECTCGQTDGVTVADNFVPWGESICLVPPDVKEWEVGANECPQVTCPSARFENFGVFQTDSWSRVLIG